MTPLQSPSFESLETDRTAQGREEAGPTELVSVILPTFNERENILNTISAILAHVRPAVEIIVVDDDSPDKTWQLVDELGDPRVKVIRRVGTRGLASAINRGILESRGGIVGWMDADLSMPAELLPALISKTGQAEVVVGSRYVEGGRDDRPALRVWSSRLVNGLASLVLGHGIKDYDSGFIVLRRAVFDRVTLMPIGYGSYFIDLLYGCARSGMTVLEVPYTFTDRTRGVSKSSPTLWQFFTAGLAYVATIFLTRLRPGR
jgi:dolichol-phosphate mannosyltransferase